MGEGNKLCILLKASLKKSVPDIDEWEQTYAPIPKMLFFLEASFKRNLFPTLSIGNKLSHPLQKCVFKHSSKTELTLITPMGKNEERNSKQNRRKKFH